MAPAIEVELESVALDVSIQSSEMDGPRSEPIELTALSLVVSITVLGMTDVTEALLAPANPMTWFTGWLSNNRGVYIALEMKNN